MSDPIMSMVATREKASDRGARIGRQAMLTMGRELREARLSHDLSQEIVARTLGVSDSTIGRWEQGRLPGPSILDLARAMAVVGLDLHVRAYPGAGAIRDGAHLALLERLRSRLGSGMRWSTEVPLPDPGDPRAWDAVIAGAVVRVGVEAETRVRDGQDLQRRLALKRRDGGVDHVILLLADTRHHRRFVREHQALLASAFPLPGRIALERLAAGRDPGDSAIILL